MGETNTPLLRVIRREHILHTRHRPTNTLIFRTPRLQRIKYLRNLRAARADEAGFEDVDGLERVGVPEGVDVLADFEV